MRNRTAHLDELAAVPLFRNCTRKELQTLGAHTTEVRAQAGRVLVREGQLGVEFFVVVAGHGEVTRDGVVVDTVGPGDFFGELALLDPELRDATVTAISPMELLVLSRSEFEAALFAAPTMTRVLLAGMARRLRGLDHRNRPTGGDPDEQHSHLLPQMVF